MVKRKIRRKDLKRPDEFVSLSTRILSRCRDNIRIVVGAAAGLAFIFLLASGIFMYRANQDEKAEDLYHEALAAYPSANSSTADAPGYTAAIARLEQVLGRYPSTNVATRALADLGNACFQSEDYDRAIDCYEDFLERVHRGHPLYDPILESLGATHEARRSWDAALEAYKRLLREGSPMYQTQAHLYLGRVYEAMGDQTRAMSHYERYLEENPETLFSDWIETKVMRFRLAGASGEQG